MLFLYFVKVAATRSCLYSKSKLTFKVMFSFYYHLITSITSLKLKLLFKFSFALKVNVAIFVLCQSCCHSKLLLLEVLIILITLITLLKLKLLFNFSFAFKSVAFCVLYTFNLIFLNRSFATFKFQINLLVLSYFNSL